MAVPIHDLRDDLPRNATGNAAATAGTQTLPRGSFSWRRPRPEIAPTRPRPRAPRAPLIPDRLSSSSSTRRGRQGRLGVDEVADENPSVRCCRSAPGHHGPPRRAGCLGPASLVADRSHGVRASRRRARSSARRYQSRPQAFVPGEPPGQPGGLPSRSGPRTAATPPAPGSGRRRPPRLQPVRTQDRRREGTPGRRGTAGTARRSAATGAPGSVPSRRGDCAGPPRADRARPAPLRAGSRRPPSRSGTRAPRRARAAQSPARVRLPVAHQQAEQSGVEPGVGRRERDGPARPRGPGRAPSAR